MTGAKFLSAFAPSGASRGSADQDDPTSFGHDDGITLSLGAAARAALMAASTALAFGGTFGAASRNDCSVKIDLRFIFHVDEDIAEQDVFYERVPGSGEVFRPTRSTPDMSLPLFAAAEPVRHTPHQPDNVGPWRRGAPLGITLGEWFGAKGRGRYECRDNFGHLRIKFEKLIPNGVYTLWHDCYSWPPNSPGDGTYDVPVGAPDGSENTFYADADGNALVERSFRQCLPPSREQMLSELSIAWHSDGRTYRHEPGEFSTRTHVQLYAGLAERAVF